MFERGHDVWRMRKREPSPLASAGTWGVALRCAYSGLEKLSVKEFRRIFQKFSFHIGAVGQLRQLMRVVNKVYYHKSGAFADLETVMPCSRLCGLPGQKG